MPELPYTAAPDRFYALGKYRFGRYGWLRWECNAENRGVGNHLTPIGAWWSLRRFLREPRWPNELPADFDPSKVHFGGPPDP